MDTLLSSAPPLPTHLKSLRKPRGHMQALLGTQFAARAATP
ncbi:hypothetical protein [Ralstonia thomasii]|jgi:hypothetical protein